MATPFLAGRSLRAAATVATGTCVVVSTQPKDESQERTSLRLLNAHTASREPEQRFPPIVYDGEHRLTRSPSIPAWKKDLPQLDLASQPWLDHNGVTISAATDLATPENAPNPTGKTQLPPDGLYAQPWFDNDESITQRPISLLSSVAISCEEPMKQNDTTATSTELTTTPTGITIPEWKKQLLSSPELLMSPWIEREEVVTKKFSLSKTFPWFTRKHVTEVLLIGVAHGTNTSAQNVKLLLEEVTPDAAFLELCKERGQYLSLDADTAKQQTFPLMQIIQGIHESGMSPGQSLEQLGSDYQKHWIATHGSGYGGEFRVAFEYMQSLPSDCQFTLFLGDRPKSISFARTMDAVVGKAYDSTDVMNLGELYGSESPRPLNNLEELRAQGEAVRSKAWNERQSWSDYIMRGYFDNEARIASLALNYEEIQFPTGTERRVMIQERDIYMVCKLVQLCRDPKIDRVVAVVGASHLRGMSHLLRTGVIGSAIEPEEVLPHLIASHKYPEGDPSLQGLVWGTTYVVAKK